MIRRLRVLQHSARQAANAALGTLETLKDQRVEQEPAFTDRMLGRIEQAMEGYVVKGVRWTAKTLTDHGPNTQEKKYGADFASVLEIALPDFSVKKGFLAQAKLIHPNKPMNDEEFLRLQGQCGDMLDLSVSSFVFVYSPDSIIVVPALSVVGSQPRDLRTLDHKSLAAFFQEHFACFIGDREINAPNPDMLKELHERFSSRRLLYLRVERAT